MTLEEWIAWEQACLWSDLDEAIRRAANGVWSMGCESVSSRIAGCIKATGHVTPWSEVPWNLATGGVYEALVGIAGAEAPMPTDDVMKVSVEAMVKHAGYHSPEWHRQDLALTVAMLSTDRQLRLDLEFSDV